VKIGKGAATRPGRGKRRHRGHGAGLVERGGATPRGVFVRADSKGVTDGVSVRADSKGLICTKIVQNRAVRVRAESKGLTEA